MRNLVFRNLLQLRQNYWFWPSALTAFALLLGFTLPVIDAYVGISWIRSVGFLRPTEVEGARAILTTLAGAALGVAGVAFSITILAVSFASANYGPRLIGNFMRDRLSQLVLGVFVSTFVYCIAVLATIHTQRQFQNETIQAFVPQISVMFAIFLTLLSVAALIVYIHHVPESINIMNLVAEIGATLRSSVIQMLDEEDARGKEQDEVADVGARTTRPRRDGDTFIIYTDVAGYLQQLDLKGLRRIGDDKDLQITITSALGDFLAEHEPVMTVHPAEAVNDTILNRLKLCFTQGSSRTDLQDILFLSDQLVEVLARALSRGVNDPHTAILCLDWLRAGLSAFARRTPAQASGDAERVRHTRVTFELMLTRSFRQMRQYIAADRTVTIHTFDVLADLAIVAVLPSMVDAISTQIRELAEAANDSLPSAIAREEVAAACEQAREKIANSDKFSAGESSARAS